VPINKVQNNAKSFNKMKHILNLHAHIRFKVHTHALVF